MKKNRFRKVKQGKVQSPQPSKKSSKNRDSNGIAFIKKGDFFKALLTDSFMLLMPIMYIVFYLVFGSREGFRENMLLGWVYILIPLALVEIIFIAKAGQTPGMRAYNIKLISLKDKKKPKLSTVFIRQILSKLAFITFGWIFIFFNKEGRHIYDLALNTALIYDDSANKR